MSKVKVLVDSGVCEIDGTIIGDTVLVSPEAIHAALGWEIKPAGICKGNLCIPLHDRTVVVRDEGIDLVAVAHLVGSETLIDTSSSIVAVSLPVESRHQPLMGRQAANFTLPDLDGNLHSLNEFDGNRRLLVAFATW